MYSLRRCCQHVAIPLFRARCRATQCNASHLLLQLRTSIDFSAWEVCWCKLDHMHSYRTDVWGSSGVCVSWHVFCLTSSSNRNAFDIFHTFCCACTLPQVYCAGAPLHPKIHDREPRCMGHHMKAPSRGFHILGVQSKILKLTKQSKTKIIKLHIFKCLLAFLK